MIFVLHLIIVVTALQKYVFEEKLENYLEFLV